MDIDLIKFRIIFWSIAWVIGSGLMLLGERSAYQQTVQKLGRERAQAYFRRTRLWSALRVAIGPMWFFLGPAIMSLLMLMSALWTSTLSLRKASYGELKFKISPQKNIRWICLGLSMFCWVLTGLTMHVGHGTIQRGTSIYFELCTIGFFVSWAIGLCLIGWGSCEFRELGVCEYYGSFQWDRVLSYSWMAAKGKVKGSWLIVQVEPQFTVVPEPRFVWVPHGKRPQVIRMLQEYVPNAYTKAIE